MVQPMLPASIHKGLDIAESLGSIFTTETSGHVEFGFQTSSSPFGLIVGAGRSRLFPCGGFSATCAIHRK
jgi:hypothetical protein